MCHHLISVIFFNKINLCHILNLSALAPLWKMTRKKVFSVSTKKENYQFQVGFVSYLNFKKNKAFNEKVDMCLSSMFDFKTWNNDNSHAEYIGIQ